MGKKVNVVLPGGRIVSVDEELAREGGLEAAPDEAIVARETARAREEAASGIGQGLAAIGEGFLDTATFGAFGSFAEDISPEYGEEMRLRAEERPGMRLAGSALSVLAPTGALGGAARAATTFTGPGAAAAAGRAIGGARGVAAEGAILGLGGYVQEAQLSGDPLTIEGAALSVGLGALMDVGVSKLAGGIAARGERARGVLEKFKEADADRKLVTDNRQIFEETTQAGYGELREAHESVLRAARSERAEALAEHDAWKEIASPEGVRKVSNGYQKIHSELLAEIQGTAYGKQVRAAAESKRDEIANFTKRQAEVEKFFADSKRVPDTLRGYQNAIDEVADRYGFGPKTKKDYEKALTAWTKQRDAAMAKWEATKAAKLREWEDAKERARVAGKAFYEREPDVPEPRIPKRPEPPEAASPERIAEIKELSQQLSSAAKMVAGRYDVAAKRWNPSGDVADPEGALRELHALREKLHKYTFIPKPKLPQLPVRPEDWKLPEAEVDVSDVKVLSGAANRLHEALEASRGFAREGHHDRALDALAVAADDVRAMGFHDLPFPDIPYPTRSLDDLPEIPEHLDLPKNLTEFARKTPEKVAELTAFLERHDPSGRVTEAIQRLAGNSGLLNAGEEALTLAGLHRKISNVTKAYDRLVAAGKGGKSGGFGQTLMDLASGAAVGAAGFGAFGMAGGGIMGAATGALARRATRLTMDSVDATLMTSRSNLKRSVAWLVSKVGTVAEKGGKLSPVTAHLAGRFLSGEPDDGDTREQASRRIDEIIHASMNAPDLAFMALEPLLGHPADIAGKLSGWTLGAINHLRDKLPRDPGLDITPTGSNWRPSHTQAIELAHRIEAVVDPLTAVERTIRGEGHPAGAETLWAVYPQLMSELAGQFASQAKEMTYEQGSVISMLFRVPMTGLQQPAVAVALQGMYLPREQGQGQGQGAGGPGGRPAAVQSKVAGSSVSGLIS